MAIILIIAAIVAVGVIAAVAVVKSRNNNAVPTVFPSAADGEHESSAASDASSEDTDGDSLSGDGWYYSGGELTVRLSGKMPDYSETSDGSSAPWNSLREKVTSISFTDNITTIGTNAFREFTALTSVELPSGVTDIGNSAFFGCSALESVTLPKTLKRMGSSAFYCCTALTTLTIGGVQTIGSQAFYYCEELKNSGRSARLVIPNTIEVIESEAFYGCGRLNAVDIMKARTAVQISPDAFPEDCKVSHVEISTPTPKSTPKSAPAAPKTPSKPAVKIDTVAEDAVNYIPGSRKRVWWTFDNGTLTISGKGVIPGYHDSATGTTSRTPWEEYAASVTLLIIEEGITAIGQGAFISCKNLRTVTVPNSVTTIERSAFKDCGKLVSAALGSGITQINNWAFCNCKSLSSITLPDSLTEIGGHAFEGCTALSSVTIPGSTTKIGAWAFRNCPSLKSVIIENTSSNISAPKDAFPDDCNVVYKNDVTENAILAGVFDSIRNDHLSRLAGILQARAVMLYRSGQK